MIEMTPIEHRDVPAAHEGDGNESVPNPLRAQHGFRERYHAVAADRRAHSFDCHVDVETHTDANSDVTPPLAAG
jgi:hypothetical protein